MKKKIKEFIISGVLSMLCGFICGKLLYGIYDKNFENLIDGKKIYLIQAGAYSTYDNMASNTSLKNYIYYEDDDGLFKSIIGLTEEYDNIEIIKKIYGADVVVSEYYSMDKELNKKIEDYDKRIMLSNSNEEVKEVVMEMLSLYKDNDSALVQVMS